MEIRNYQPGDERAQAEVYNAAAAALPGFKPARAEEIARRYRGSDPDPGSKLYAVADGRVVGYATFHPGGRISFPWCLPGSESARGPLLEAMLAAMARRGMTRAWTTYRADWTDVLAAFEAHGFVRTREMINYVAEVARLPRRPVPDGQRIGPWERRDVARLLELGEGLFDGDDPQLLGTFFWENPHFPTDALFALRRGEATLGLGLAIVAATFADPTQLDAAMPCFRLGALGTESQRHKRVNGLVSCVFVAADVAEVLLSEAARRLDAAGLAHAATQAPSDRPELVALYDRHFRRQGAFPILERRL